MSSMGRTWDGRTIPRTWNSIVIPSPQTLEKYGLDLRAWKVLAKRQAYVCGVCGKLPDSGKLVVDHEHVPSWSRKSPEQRALAVRGLLCSWDNWKMIPRGMTASKARAVADYLEAYDRRKDE